MKTHTFTSDDIHTTTDYANGERNTINLEDAELLPEGAKMLTREEVAHLLYLSTQGASHYEILTRVFGESPCPI